MRNRFLKSLLVFAIIASFSTSIFATADTIRVVRGGFATKTSSPIVTNLTVEGTLTASGAWASAANISILKATPSITAKSSTNTPSSLVLDAGAGSNAFVSLKDDGAARWTFGLDSGDSDAFIVAASGSLGTSNSLKVTSTGVEIPGTLTSTGAFLSSSTATVVGAVSMQSTLAVSGASTLTNLTVTGSMTAQKKLVQKSTTLADGATAIDASLGNVFVTQANTGATVLASISNPTAGQIIHIVGGSSTNATTLADAGNFKLSDAMTFNENDSLTLLIVDLTTFVEIARADN